MIVNISKVTVLMVAGVLSATCPLQGTADSTISGSLYVDQIVQSAGERYGLDPLLIHAVIGQESAYDIYAVSHKGAQGLMQLMPATQQELGVNNVFDPRENVDAGVRYLLRQLLEFRSLDRALAAYNAGPGREMHRKRPRETTEYVARVVMRFKQLKSESR